jgi:replicative DNA helicase
MAQAEPLQQTLERTAPHDVDAEEGLLAACIIEGGHEILTDCLQQRVAAESFYKPSHRLIYEALLDLVKQDKVEVDEIILADKLRSMGHLDEVGGIEGINRLTGRIETTVHAAYWIEIVLEKALRRSLISTCVSVVEDCYAAAGEITDFLEKIEQNIFNLRNDQGSTTAQPLRDPVEAASQLISRQINKESSADGVMTGFKDLDAMTQGFLSGQMIVLAARPSVGKTSLAMNFAEHAICPPGMREPIPTLVFSLEMTSEQLAYRLVCSRARVDMSRLREGFSQPKDQARLAQVASDLKEAPMWIDDASTISIYEMKAKARRLNSSLISKKQPPLGLIVIDYLQLISSADRNSPREQQISEISRAIKGMAKDLKLPVVVLSQLNRDMEKEKRDPRLSDLRESGAIEQDADVVLLLNRQHMVDDINEGDDGDGQHAPGPLGSVQKIKLIVAKQRNGPVGDVLLSFLRHYTRFENHAP